MSVAEITQTHQYLTFTLVEEVFAIEVGKVREILEFSRITRVPQVPDFMCGVINLRGGVVPVVDLRLKLGMAPSEQTVSTCIIVVEVELDGDMVIIGALADSVQEVVDMEPEQIEPPPHIGTSLNPAFIKGMGKFDGAFVMILNVDKVFTEHVVNQIHETLDLAT